VARLRPSLDWLLVLVPISIALELAGGDDLLIFVASAGAILPLAGLIGRATEQLALHTGPRIGGLINATFGNVTELIIAIFLILDDEIEIVKASLTGSILGNLLLVLGLSFLLGGLKHEQQSYNAQAAQIHATSLVLAVTGLLMPALFALGSGNETFLEREVVSATVAAVLIALYAAALAFTLVTHEHLFRTPAPEEHPDWSRRKAIGLLLGATAVVALEAEFLVASVVDFFLRDLKAKGSPVDHLWPREGAILIPTPAGIVQGARNVAAAQAFLRYLYSADGQRLFVQQGYVPVLPGIEGPKGMPPEKLEILATDEAYIATHREELKAKYRELFETK